jgi:predicted dehydrogenase
MCPGHERWHPNPAFYYDIGGGPMLDMGPYYITDLVNLLGPVARVSGVATTPQQTRTITAKERLGEVIPVYVPTHVSGTLLFRNGAAVQMTMSFDVAGHKHVPLEVYGTEGTLIVPDPNHFGGQIETLKKGGEWTNVATDMPYADGNYRSIGLADMAHAIRAGRPIVPASTSRRDVWCAPPRNVSGAEPTRSPLARAAATSFCPCANSTPSGFSE